MTNREIVALKEQRTRVLREQRKLIDDGGETEANSNRIKEFDAEIDRLDDAILSEERQLASLLDATPGEIPPIKPESGRVTSRSRKQVDAEGNGFRLFRAGERIIDDPETTAGEGETGVPVRDLRNLSWGRYLKGRLTGDWRGAPEERNLVNLYADSDSGKITMPWVSAQWLDEVKDASVAERAGATTVLMDRREAIIPSVDQQPEAEWLAEGQKLSTSSIELGQLRLVTKKISVTLSATQEMMSSAEMLERIIREQMLMAVTRARDSAMLHGDGSGQQPVGILNTPGINSRTLTGALELDDLSTAYWKIMSENGGLLGRPITIIHNADIAAIMDKLKTGTGEYFGFGNGRGPDGVESMRRVVTNLIPTESNKSKIYIGDFSQVYIGVQNSIQFVASRDATVDGESAFERGLVLLKMNLFCDIGIGRPSWLYVIEDVPTS